MVKDIKFPREDLVKFKTFNCITCLPSKLQEKIKELNLNIDKLDIKIQQSRLIAMNALCPCGSNRIFKRCCYKKEREVTYIIQESKVMSKLEYEDYVERQRQAAYAKLPEIIQKQVPIALADNHVANISEQFKICPICGNPPQFFGGEPWFEMVCANKHLWHICLKHNTIIIGAPNRGITGCECQR